MSAVINLGAIASRDNFVDAIASLEGKMQLIVTEAKLGSLPLNLNFLNRLQFLTDVALAHKQASHLCQVDPGWYFVRYQKIMVLQSQK